MATKSNGAAKPRKTAADRVEVRKSGIHGRGVYATAPIRKGERVIEYTGEHMPWDKAMDLPPRDPDDPFHTFFFSLDNGDVIDAGRGGNDARWINHSCDPNCEAVEEDDRVFIYALRDLSPGEELFYDYALEIDEPRSEETEKQFQCFCGTRKCRGTLLAAEEETVAAGT